VTAGCRRRPAGNYRPCDVPGGRGPSLTKTTTDDWSNNPRNAERPEQTLFEICSRLSMKHQLGMSRQAVSQHIAVLEAAGLVESRRAGLYKFHDPSTAPLERIAERWSRPDAPEVS